MPPRPRASEPQAAPRRRATRASSSGRSSPRPRPDAPCANCGWKPRPGQLWPSEGATAVSWIQDNLIFAEGDWFARPFRLRADQQLFLYRWYEYCDRCGWWRFRRGLRGAAKGDGKTELIAGIGCLEFAGPPSIAITSPNIPIMAATFEQADKLFGAAATMLGGRDNSVTEAPLCGFFEVYDTEVKFADGRPGRLYRVAAAAGSNDGGLPSTVIADEVHELGLVGSNKARVHLILTNGLTKRLGPRGPGRELDLSTAGFQLDGSLLGEMYKDGRKVARDQRVDPEYLFDWQEAPDGLDYDNPAHREIAVKAASKAAGVLFSVDERVRRYDRPGVQKHEWIRYFANRWVDVAEESWLADHPAAWDKCRGPETIPAQAEVKVAVDMALKRDSVAVLVGHQLPEGRVVVRSRVWHPAGGRIDHLDVMTHIRELALGYDVVEITYDPRFFEVPARLLEDEGFNMVEFPQSPERMAPACGHALEAILGRQIIHDGDLDLTDHVKSAVKRAGERGFTLSKGKSRRHIDAAVALVILLWRIAAPDPEEPDVEPFAVWA